MSFREMEFSPQAATIVKTQPLCILGELPIDMNFEKLKFVHTESSLSFGFLLPCLFPFTFVTKNSLCRLSSSRSVDFFPVGRTIIFSTVIRNSIKSNGLLPRLLERRKTAFIFTIIGNEKVAVKNGRSNKTYRTYFVIISSDSCYYSATYREISPNEVTIFIVK